MSLCMMYRWCGKWGTTTKSNKHSQIRLPYLCFLKSQVPFWGTDLSLVAFLMTPSPSYISLSIKNDKLSFLQGRQSASQCESYEDPRFWMNQNQPEKFSWWLRELTVSQRNIWDVACGTQAFWRTTGIKKVAVTFPRSLCFLPGSW